MPRKGKKALYVDDELHKEVKETAEKKGITIQELVETTLTKAVEVPT